MYEVTLSSYYRLWIKLAVSQTRRIFSRKKALRLIIKSLFATMNFAVNGSVNSGNNGLHCGKLCTLASRIHKIRIFRFLSLLRRREVQAVHDEGVGRHRHPRPDREPVAGGDEGGEVVGVGGVEGHHGLVHVQDRQVGETGAVPG